MKILFYYLAIINALSFLLMLIDKQKAKKNRWRIPENTLLGVCLIGGSLGGIIAMNIFRHKTQHLRFSVGIPLMLILHIVALYFIDSKLF